MRKRNGLDGTVLDRVVSGRATKFVNWSPEDVEYIEDYGQEDEPVQKDPYDERQYIRDVKR